MKALQTTLFVLHRRSTRTVRHPAPVCESLEGRQLLNGTWGSSEGHWDEPPSGTAGSTPAEVHQFAIAGARGAHHAPKSGTFAQGHEPGNTTHAAPNAQAQADMQTLQADLKAFQAQIPSSLTATIQTDQAAIKNAVDALTPAQRKALMPSSPPSSTTAPNPTTQLQTLLTAANVPNASQILADFQNYETTVQALDPTLQAKIATDQANLAKDLGITLPTPPSGTTGLTGIGLGLGFPGGPSGFGGPGGKGGHGGLGTL